MVWFEGRLFNKKKKYFLCSKKTLPSETESPILLKMLPLLNIPFLVELDELERSGIDILLLVLSKHPGH
jgi:hypothetical protein